LLELNEEVDGDGRRGEDEGRRTMDVVVVEVILARYEDSMKVETCEGPWGFNYVAVSLDVMH